MNLFSGTVSEITSTESRSKSYLLPPGTSSRSDYLDRCTQCFECISICPHEALEVCRDNKSELYGYPVITPRRQPCSLCSDFPCIQACDEQVLSRADADHPLGTAIIIRSRCLIAAGSFCRACINRCPTQAIFLNTDGLPAIQEEKCTGCGECVQACPPENPALFIKSAL